MKRDRDPKNKGIAIAVVVLVAALLLFLAGCAFFVVPNNLQPGTVMPLTVQHYKSD